MTGHYSGLQDRIKKKSKLAKFVPCTAHSLNLVGICAAECCPLHQPIDGWSARVDASTVLNNSYDAFKEALEVTIADSEQSPKTKAEGKGVLQKMLNLETGVILSFWKDVLIQKKRKLLPGGYDKDIVFDGKRDMEVNMYYMVIDNIVSELEK
ncbi:hypothetical protein ILUMI_23753 [Ignelater luminosus]|uniref:DUF4371 domain-containing protein n=1 Tax=Ignelater luminosus TaxID=2038154 RepID=A0A8K0G1M0_IGNLU|nr:hypothetical protein ILUMI_23753 [Ignelater luminosus]